MKAARPTFSMFGAAAQCPMVGAVSRGDAAQSRAVKCQGWHMRDCCIGSRASPAYMFFLARGRMPAQVQLTGAEHARPKLINC